MYLWLEFGNLTDSSDINLDCNSILPVLIDLKWKMLDSAGTLLNEMNVLPSLNVAMFILIMIEPSYLNLKR